MSKTENKNKYSFFHPAILTGSLLILFLMGNAINWGGWASAQETTEKVPSGIDNTVPQTGTKNEISLVIGEKCEIGLKEYGDKEFAVYMDFMEQHFKNKSSTTSLMDLAMKRYEKFKTDIHNRYSLLVTDQIGLAGENNAVNTTQGAGIERCEALRNQYIEDAAKLVSMRAISTSNSKKTSAFVEKYKQINGKLGTLNLDMMRMVTSLATFEQKLPCYLKTCLSK